MKRFLVASVLLTAALSAGQTRLSELINSSPALSFRAATLKAHPPHPGWNLGMVSWIAVDRTGLIYLLQRGDKAAPIVVLDREGHVVRSWGKGMFTMPHSIRIDPQGNVWTTDAASSVIYEFSPQGEKLLEIHVGGQPSPCRDIVDIEEGNHTANNFCGTTDTAFAPNGHVFITDGYANARVLEYTREGKKIREWGSHGRGPGQFRLVHSIQIDSSGVIYVSDRENGRVERFDLKGKYLGEWNNLGRIFSLKLDGDSIWLATQPDDQPNFVPGWLLKLDRRTGKLLGHVDVTGVHGMDALSDGELFVGPGPNQDSPQWLQPLPTAGQHD